MWRRGRKREAEEQARQIAEASQLFIPCQSISSLLVLGMCTDLSEVSIMRRKAKVEKEARLLYTATRVFSLEYPECQHAISFLCCRDMTTSGGNWHWHDHLYRCGKCDGVIAVEVSWTSRS